MPLSHLRRPLFLALVLYMAALAGLHALGVFAVHVPSWQLDWRRDADVRLAGLVVSPRREDLRGIKFVLDDAEISGQKLGVKVLCYLPRDLKELEDALPGRRVELVGRMRLPRTPRNPGEYDERVLLSDRGIGWIMQSSAMTILSEPVSARWRLALLAERARLSMQRAFERGLDDEDAALMTAFTLGYKGPLPRELNRAVQDAGAMHLLVPSGAKVAFVLLGVTWLCALFGATPSVRLAAAAIFGGFYTVMVGGEPPYARAYLGALALGLGLLSDRESGAFQATVLSAWLILIVEPKSLFSAGFQMTYLAMIGLIVAMPQVNAALPVSWLRPIRNLICVAAVTAIVEIMLWPVFANTFGRGALLGACANLPLVPLSGVILCSGFAFWARLLPALPLAWLLRVFRWICFKAADLPFAAVDLAPMTCADILVYYLFAAALLILPRKRSAAVLATAGIVVLALSTAVARLTTKPLRIIYLCLPGENVAIARSHGETLLIGPNEPSATVRRALISLNVRLDRTVALAQNPGFKLCEEKVCFLFDPPRVLKDQREFDIIRSRLKNSALEASTDGSRIEIKDEEGSFH